MSRVCFSCGRGPVVGHNVSRANNRTKRRWLPNLHRVRVMVDGEPRRVRLCSRCVKAEKYTKAP